MEPINLISRPENEEMIVGANDGNEVWLWGEYIMVPNFKRATSPRTIDNTYYLMTDMMHRHDALEHATMPRAK